MESFESDEAEEKDDCNEDFLKSLRICLMDSCFTFSGQKMLESSLRRTRPDTRNLANVHDVI